MSMELSTAATLAKSMLQQFGLNYTFQFDRGRRRFGYCDGVEKVISLSAPLTTLNTEETVRGVVLHEIAHALVGNRHGHDRTWRAKLLEIGGDGKRCYKREAVVMPPPKYSATCGVCQTVYSKYRRPRGSRICTKCYNTSVDESKYLAILEFK